MKEKFSGNRVKKIGFQALRILKYTHESNSAHVRSRRSCTCCLLHAANASRGEINMRAAFQIFHFARMLTKFFFYRHVYDKNFVLIIFAG